MNSYILLLLFIVSTVLGIVNMIITIYYLLLLLFLLGAHVIQSIFLKYGVLGSHGSFPRSKICKIKGSSFNHTGILIII